MSWDPDGLPDMDGVSDVPVSVMGTAHEESMRDDQELFGSVGDNTQELPRASSPLLHSDSEEDGNGISVLHGNDNDGQPANTGFPKREFLKAF